MSGTIATDPVGSPNLADVVIRASAGTGKTFQLTSRYLSLFLAGVPVDRILATTFTRKAAGEILERVLLRLAKAVLDESDRDELLRSTERPDVSSRQLRESLVRMVRQLHRVRISTLDSFFAQIAKSHGLELELPPGWEIVDEVADAQLVTRAIDDTLQNGTTQDTVRLMHLLAHGQVTRAVGDLVRSAVDGFHGLFAESDETAWHRFAEQAFPTREDIERLRDELATLELPKNTHWENARAKDVVAFEDENWQAIIGKGISAALLADKDSYQRNPIESHVRDVYTRLVAVARAHVVEEVRLQTAATYELVARFDESFRALKQRERRLRFDDITHRLADRLTDLTAARLAFRLDTRLEHVLLDEFQDTSIAQWTVLRAFARDVAVERPDRSLFCVGDAKQAIYAWRGGVAEVFDALEEEIITTDRLSLTTSYRSAPVVVETVNRVFENAATTPRLGNLEAAVREWCSRFETHSTARTSYEGFTRLNVAPQPEEGEGEQHAMVRAAADVVADVRKRAPGRTVGVLVRRRAVVGWIVFELRRRGIAASEEGGNPLVDSAAVALVLSLLRLVDHPGSTAPRFHLATSPLGRSLGFVDRRDDDGARELAQRIRCDLVERGYGAVVYDWARRLVPHCSHRDAERLGLLVRLAYDYQSEATLRARDFVRYVEHKRVAVPGRRLVRVMTIHQSKGLQFDAVVLPELSFELYRASDSYVVGRPTPTSPPERICLYRNETVRSVLPKEWQRVFEENAARRTRETMCLLYVALTRAVHELQMIIPQPGQRQFHKSPSAILRHTLGGEAEKDATVLYESGNPNWAGGTATVVADEDDREPERVEIKLAEMTDGRRRGRDRVAPSQQQAGRSVRLHDVLERGNAAAMERGTLIHAWFESVDWLDDGAPDDGTLVRLGEELGASRALVESSIPAFRAALREPAIAWCLSRGSYSPPRDLRLAPHVLDELGSSDLRFEIQSERRFSVHDGGTVVTGSIDRLVLMFTGTSLLAADILDFKTDSIDGTDRLAVEERVDHHRPQMTAYLQAVSRMYRLPEDRISTRLVLLGPGLVEPISP